jgi:hypothetical protein
MTEASVPSGAEALCLRAFDGGAEAPPLQSRLLQEVFKKNSIATCYGSWKSMTIWVLV